MSTHDFGTDQDQATEALGTSPGAGYTYPAITFEPHEPALSDDLPFWNAAFNAAFSTFTFVIGFGLGFYVAFRSLGH